MRFFCELKEKHDILTGLFNRRAYEYEIQHLESLGYGAIIFFDVDDFKKSMTNLGTSMETSVSARLPV